MSVFKDFPRLENLEKKFKDFQGPARAQILHGSKIISTNVQEVKSYHST